MLQEDKVEVILVCREKSSFFFLEFHFLDAHVTSGLSSTYLLYRTGCRDHRRCVRTAAFLVSGTALRAAHRSLKQDIVPDEGQVPKGESAPHTTKIFFFSKTVTFSGKRSQKVGRVLNEGLASRAEIPFGLGPSGLFFQLRFSSRP